MCDPHHCILWEGTVNADGYGVVWREGKMRLIHRWVYAQAHCNSIDDIDGVVIRHTCDTPRCINTTHLLTGTQSQNMHDKKRPGRIVNKLCREDVEAIRVRLDSGEIARTIAADFGVCRSMISNIKRGVAWRIEDLPAT